MSKRKRSGVVQHTITYAMGHSIANGDAAFWEFRSFRAAEKWAREHIVDLMKQDGFSRPLDIYDDSTGTHVATIRIDAKNRVWTDLR